MVLINLIQKNRSKCTLIDMSTFSKYYDLQLNRMKTIY